MPLEFKELVPNLVGYSIGSSSSLSVSYEPIDPCVAIETRINTANALEYVLADLCKKRLLIYKKYIVSICSTHISNIVTNGLMYSMNHLTSANANPLLAPIILQYAIVMTKITHHLILSSLSSLPMNKKNSSQQLGSDINTAEIEVNKAVDNVFELLLEYIPLSCKQLRENSHNTTHMNNSNNGPNGTSTTNQSIHDNLKELLEEFYRLVVATQKYHPISFSRYIGPFLTLFYNEIEQMVLLSKASNSNVTSVNNNGTTAIAEPLLFAIPQITFFANVISCSHYIPDENSNESMEAWRSSSTNTQRVISSQGDLKIDPLSVNSAVQNVWSFLTMERVKVLVDVSLFFITLRDSHLAEWADDPESFYIERKNAVTDDDVISCAQNMYLSLLESKCCKPIVLEKISSLLLRVDDQLRAAHFESGAGGGNLNEINISSVLFWDAAYTAIGLSLHDLKLIGLDVNNWFESSLSQVIKVLMAPQQNEVCVSLFSCICHLSHTFHPFAK